jgi:hypothetical protein
LTDVSVYRIQRVVTNKNAVGVPVPKELAKGVKRFIEQHGLKYATEVFETSRDSIVRVAAGMPVRKSTLFVVSERLKEFNEGKQ